MRFLKLHALATFGASALVALLLLSCQACGRGEIIPTERDVLAYPASDFIVGNQVTGIRANYDVDAVMFKYTCSSANAGEFWALLESKVRDSRWAEIASGSSTSERAYERVEPGSVTRVRIAYIPQTRSVVVASVQADTGKRFEDAPEGRWADYWWGRFNDQVSLCQ